MGTIICVVQGKDVTCDANCKSQLSDCKQLQRVGLA
jgi:hypothetical protein